jgi:HPt (histidine-containing phosphotransfer) domain-containing protein
MSEGIIYINVEEGLKRVISNSRLYVKLLGKFKDDLSFNEIKEAIKDGDMAKAQSATHTLKGLTANLSLTELYKQCMELESQIKAGSLQEGQLNIVADVYDKTLLEIDRVIAQYA